MKTHAMAKSLRILADILEATPNTELNKDITLNKENSLKASEVAVSLQTLLKLSKFNKKDWVRLVKEYNFNIEIKDRFSSRDIIGKILAYLDKNPEAIDKMKRKSSKERENDSPLMKALDLLVQGDDYERTKK